MYKRQALELIVRGHRLVTDDAVIIKKVSDETLVGKSPELTKHLIELRGIGIIDVKEIFGVESCLLYTSCQRLRKEQGNGIRWTWCI